MEYFMKIVQFAGICTLRMLRYQTTTVRVLKTDFHSRPISKSQMRYYLFGTSISGADVSSLAKAIKSARKKTLGADADCDWDAKFYSGTNYLAVIHLNRDVIMVEDVQYHDGTGFVMTFWQKLVKAATAR